MATEFGEEKAERLLKGISCGDSLSTTVLHRGPILDIPRLGAAFVGMKT
jgi:hypothetical protein